nr:hypothetical protein [Tanacetum cinerariifolium]
RRHKFHPRPNSPLYLPNEEPVLGYLKFSAKGTKREVFRMPIPSQPAPTSAPAKPQEKKRKQAIETSDKPPKAKKSKYGWVSKKRTLKNVEALKAEEVLAMEPQVAAEDTDIQKALEQSMKTAYALSRGPLPPVVIREPVSRKYQPLPETSLANQYIFQRRVSEPTGSFRHDESPYDLLGQSDSEEELEKVMLRADEGGQDEGQAGPDPGDAGAKVQSIPSPVVHTGSDREQIDLDVADVSPQPSTEQLDEGFIATVYPKVQENLKLVVEKQVLLEEPASSSGTLSSLQHLKQLDIPQQVSIDVSKVVTDAVDWAMQAPLQNHFKDLPEADMKEILHQRMWQTESYKSHEDHMQLFEALKKSMNRDHSDELAQDLAEARKKKKKSRELPKTPPGSPSYQPPPPPPPARPFGPSGAPGASGSSQVPPPPPPPPSSTSQESLSKGSAAPSPSKTDASAEYQASTMTDIRLRPSISLTPADLEMDEDIAPNEQAQLPDDEHIEPAWSNRSSDVPVPMNNWASALASNYSPPPEDSLLAQTGDITTFIDWFCKRRGITELKPQDLEGPAYEIVNVFHSDVIHLQYQMEECHKLLTYSVDDPILR